MNIKSNKGIVWAVALPWIVGALIVGGAFYEYHQLTAPGRNKTVADKTAQVVTVSSEEANRLKSDAQTAKDDLAKERTTEAKSAEADKAVHQAAGKDLEIIKASLEQDTKPTPPEVLAIGYSDAAQDALGVSFTSEQHAAFVKAILPLLKDKAALEKSVADERATNLALAAVNGSLKDQVEVLKSTTTTAVTGFSKEATAHAVTAAAGMKLAQQQKAWADREQTLLGRIKALGGLSVLLIVGAILVSIKLFGVAKTRDNTVALVESMKKWAVEGVKDAADLKTKMVDWYEHDTAAMAAVDKVKQKLRL